MPKVNTSFFKSNLKNHFKKYKSTLAFAFMIGSLIGTIPYISQSINKLRVKKLIEEQRVMQILNKEKICTDNNSNYKKFLNLGFPKTATDQFKSCMKETSEQIKEKRLNL